MKNITLKEARQRLYEAARALNLAGNNTEQLALHPALLGRVVAQDIVSLREQPAQDVSAMDGIAFKYSRQKRGDILQMVGEVAAGIASSNFDGSLLENQAVRIFTGANIPQDADTVVIQEQVNFQTKGNKQVAELTDAVQQGKNIRKRGGDFRKGEVIITANTRLNPAHLMLLAAADISTVTLKKRVKVGVIASGNELYNPLKPLPTNAAQQTAASSILSVMSLALSLGAELISDDIEIVPDSLPEIKQAFAQAKAGEIWLSSGGVSVGKYDLITKSLKELGAQIIFHGIDMRPGKPVLAATLNGALILGLPGNPVSTYVAARLMLPLAVRALSGRSYKELNWHKGFSSKDLLENGPRQSFLRARGEIKSAALWLEAFSNQDSASQSSVALSDYLLMRPINAKSVKKGEEVPCLPLMPDDWEL